VTGQPDPSKDRATMSIGQNNAAQKATGMVDKAL